MDDLITINETKYKELKKAYVEAKEKGQTQFKALGKDILVTYCKYLLEYIEGERQKKGLKIYAPEQNKMKHICNDGTGYEWISRKLTPKRCPRCKNVITK